MRVVNVRLDGGYVPVHLITRPFNTAVGKRLYRERIEKGRALLKY